jgi:hypothetical protein
VTFKITIERLNTFKATKTLWKDFSEDYRAELKQKHFNSSANEKEDKDYKSGGHYVQYESEETERKTVYEQTVEDLDLSLIILAARNLGLSAIGSPTVT